MVEYYEVPTIDGPARRYEVSSEFLQIMRAVNAHFFLAHHYSIRPFVRNRDLVTVWGFSLIELIIEPFLSDSIFVQLVNESRAIHNLLVQYRYNYRNMEGPIRRGLSRSRFPPSFRIPPWLPPAQLDNLRDNPLRARGNSALLGRLYLQAQVALAEGLFTIGQLVSWASNRRDQSLYRLWSNDSLTVDLERNIPFNIPVQPRAMITRLREHPDFRPWLEGHEYIYLGLSSFFYMVDGMSEDLPATTQSDSQVRDLSNDLSTLRLIDELEGEHDRRIRDSPMQRGRSISTNNEEYSPQFPFFSAMHVQFISQQVTSTRGHETSYRRSFPVTSASTPSTATHSHTTSLGGNHEFRMHIPFPTVQDPLQTTTNPLISTAQESPMTPVNSASANVPAASNVSNPVTTPADEPGGPQRMVTASSRSTNETVLPELDPLGLPPSYEDVTRDDDQTFEQEFHQYRGGSTSRRRRRSRRN
jgi:hypothetical protein